MKYVFLICFFYFTSIFSCAPKNYDKPKNLISKSEMINIITDLYISQQGIQIFQADYNNNNQSILLAKDALDIMKYYNVYFSDFEESYKYYSMQPELLKDMLEQVKKKLEEKLSDEEKERIKNIKNTM